MHCLFGLVDFRSSWALSGKQKRLDQVAFSAHGHPGKPLVPRPARDLGLSVEPFGEPFELACVNASLLDAIQEMGEECRRYVLAACLGHGLDAVEPASDPFLEARGLGRVRGPRQPFRQ